MDTTTKCEEPDTTINNVAEIPEEPGALPQTSQNIAEAKSSVDSKNAQARIVRGTKKMKIENVDTGQSTDKKDVKDEDNVDPKAVRSLKRSCELWSAEDKSTFFKALNEYGKDFDALQNYFLSQGRKKGLPDNMIKNKEQIRHFYYRTWLKISKHLKFSEDVKKTSQELYGLINYGELRRKLPRLHEKVHLKLNELVYWGSIQVRLRGKTIRIKTPICRALRKLNQLEDWQEEIKLPPRITVELRPGNNIAWWYVQASSMNPRVRTLLPIQRRLSSLIIFLQQRWQPATYKNYSKMENIVSDTANTRLLRVTPPQGCKIAMPAVNLGEYLTSNSVSLNSYEKRLGLRSSRTEMLGSVQYLKGVGKKVNKRYKLDKKLCTQSDDQSALPDTNSETEISETSVNITEKPSAVNNTEKTIIEKSTEPNIFPGRETIDRIKQGWNVMEANTITVGDLFLMFGRDSKITLEYWWDIHPREQESMQNQTTTFVRDDSLCLALQRLLSLAKHTYGTSKIFQTYDNTPGSSETVVSSRIPSTKESAFRRPLIPQAYHRIGTPNAFKTQLDKFKTRFCKRGRTVRQKSLVVQRVLPILSGNPQEESFSAEDQSTSKVNSLSLNADIDANDTAPVTEEDQEKHFLDELEVQSQAKTSNSIITSATQILKEGDQQWLNSEVADFSLSSFLGQLESPMKISQKSQAGEVTMEDTRPSSDVVSNLQCLIGETSVDYMAKFANFASQISSDENKK